MARILVVDDNEDNRDVLARRLAKRGFDVVVAAGGKAGVAKATEEAPDLILMDMNMPELDGWQATQMIREQGIKIPVVALTAHAMEGDRERAIAAGCTDYHTKPVDLEKLLALLERLLDEVTNSTAPKVD